MAWRVDSSASAALQNVWGLMYIDGLVLRDRDTDGNGTLDERLYCLQDGNWNAVALVDTSGDVTQRFCYQPFGTCEFLGATYSTGTNDAEWVTLFTGRELDRESRLYYFRARFLATIVGKFTNRDPIGYSIYANLYAAVFLMQQVDPLGLQPVPRPIPRPNFPRILPGSYPDRPRLGPQTATRNGQSNLRPDLNAHFPGDFTPRHNPFGIPEPIWKPFEAGSSIGPTPGTEVEPLFPYNDLALDLIRRKRRGLSCKQGPYECHHLIPQDLFKMGSATKWLPPDFKNSKENCCCIPKELHNITRGGMPGGGSWYNHIAAIWIETECPGTVTTACLRELSDKIRVIFSCCDNCLCKGACQSYCCGES